jgi:hypothetical protein
MHHLHEMIYQEAVDLADYVLRANDTAGGNAVNDVITSGRHNRWTQPAAAAGFDAGHDDASGRRARPSSCSLFGVSEGSGQLLTYARPVTRCSPLAITYAADTVLIDGDRLR